MIVNELGDLLNPGIYGRFLSVNRLIGTRLLVGIIQNLKLLKYYLMCFIEIEP